jgi:hypothetical protein
VIGALRSARAEGDAPKPGALRGKAALALALGALAAVGVTHLVDFGVYHLRYAIFDANLAASWSHAVDAAALAAGVAVCVLGARRSPSRRLTWIATATILVFFVGDEVSGLHAAIGGLRYGKLLYAPVLALLVCCVWRLTKDGANVSVVRASAGLLLASYAIHVLDPHHIARALAWPAEGWAFQCVVVLKEGMELAGVLLALLALGRTAFSTVFTSQVQAREPRSVGYGAAATRRLPSS